MNTLDMRGNPCPIPVINARKELEKEESEGVRIRIDNIVAVQNLEKMAKGLDFTFSYTGSNDDFTVQIEKQGNACPICEPMEEQMPTSTDAQGATLLIGADQLGSGSEELGKILIKGFIFSLTELPTPPKTLLFLNSGVQLTVEGSNTLGDLQRLAEKGVEILSCGTCLNYYKLTEQLAVGEITDMYGITTRLAAAAKLITI